MPVALIGAYNLGSRVFRHVWRYARLEQQHVALCVVPSSVALLFANTLTI